MARRDEDSQSDAIVWNDVSIDERVSSINSKSCVSNTSIDRQRRRAQLNLQLLKKRQAEEEAEERCLAKLQLELTEEKRRIERRRKERELEFEIRRKRLVEELEGRSACESARVDFAVSKHADEGQYRKGARTNVQTLPSSGHLKSCDDSFRCRPVVLARCKPPVNKVPKLPLLNDRHGPGENNEIANSLSISPGIRSRVDISRIDEVASAWSVETRIDDLRASVVNRLNVGGRKSHITSASQALSRNLDVRSKSFVDVGIAVGVDNLGPFPEVPILALDLPDRELARPRFGRCHLDSPALSEEGDQVDERHVDHRLCLKQVTTYSGPVVQELKPNRELLVTVAHDNSLPFDDGFIGRNERKAQRDDKHRGVGLSWRHETGRPSRHRDAVGGRLHLSAGLAYKDPVPGARYLLAREKRFRAGSPSYGRTDRPSQHRDVMDCCHPLPVGYGFKDSLLDVQYPIAVKRRSQTGPVEYRQTGRPPHYRDITIRRLYLPRRRTRAEPVADVQQRIESGGRHPAGPAMPADKLQSCSDVCLLMCVVVLNARDANEVRRVFEIAWSTEVLVSHRGVSSIVIDADFVRWTNYGTCAFRIFVALDYWRILYASGSRQSVCVQADLHDSSAKGRVRYPPDRRNDESCLRFESMERVYADRHISVVVSSENGSLELLRRSILILQLGFRESGSLFYDRRKTLSSSFVSYRRRWVEIFSNVYNNGKQPASPSHPLRYIQLRVIDVPGVGYGVVDCSRIEVDAQAVRMLVAARFGTTPGYRLPISKMRRYGVFFSEIRTAGIMMEVNAFDPKGSLSSSFMTHRRCWIETFYHIHGVELLSISPLHPLHYDQFRIFGVLGAIFRVVVCPRIEVDTRMDRRYRRYGLEIRLRIYEIGMQLAASSHPPRYIQLQILDTSGAGFGVIDCPRIEVDTQMVERLVAASVGTAPVWLRPITKMEWHGAFLSGIRIAVNETDVKSFVLESLRWWIVTLAFDSQIQPCVILRVCHEMETSKPYEIAISKTNRSSGNDCLRSLVLDVKLDRSDQEWSKSTVDAGEACLVTVDITELALFASCLIGSTTNVSEKNAKGSTISLVEIVRDSRVGLTIVWVIRITPHHLLEICHRKDRCYTPVCSTPLHGPTLWSSGLAVSMCTIKSGLRARPMRSLSDSLSSMWIRYGVAETADRLAIELAVGTEYTAVLIRVFARIVRFIVNKNFESSERVEGARRIAIVSKFVLLFFICECRYCNSTSDAAFVVERRPLRAADIVRLTAGRGLIRKFGDLKVAASSWYLRRLRIDGRSNYALKDTEVKHRFDRATDRFWERNSLPVTSNGGENALSSRWSKCWVLTECIVDESVACRRFKVDGRNRSRKSLAIVSCRLHRMLFVAVACYTPVIVQRSGIMYLCSINCSDDVCNDVPFRLAGHRMATRMNGDKKIELTLSVCFLRSRRLHVREKNARVWKKRLRLKECLFICSGQQVCHRLHREMCHADVPFFKHRGRRMPKAIERTWKWRRKHKREELVPWLEPGIAVVMIQAGLMTPGASQFSIEDLEIEWMDVSKRDDGVQTARSRRRRRRSLDGLCLLEALCKNAIVAGRAGCVPDGSPGRERLLSRRTISLPAAMAGG